MRYDFLNIARVTGVNSILKAILVIIITWSGYFLGSLPFAFFANQQVSKVDLSPEEYNRVMESMDLSFLGVDKNVIFFLVVISFLLGLTFMGLSYGKIHGRQFLSLVNSESRIDFKRLFWSFGFWMLMMFVIECAFYLSEPNNYVFHFRGSKFIMLAIITLIFIPFQIAFEEFFFRGYLIQQLGLFLPKAFISIILTSIGFGLMHSMNPEVAKFGWTTMMVYYIGIGVFLGILTILDRGMELALGIHAATNMYSAMFVTFKGSALETDALFSINDINVPYMIVGTFLSAILFFIVARKKYNFLDFKNLF
jgi:uncharacterized protein